MLQLHWLFLLQVCLSLRDRQDWLLTGEWVVGLINTDGFMYTIPSLKGFRPHFRSHRQEFFRRSEDSFLGASLSFSTSTPSLNLENVAMIDEHACLTDETGTNSIVIHWETVESAHEAYETWS
jgi:hypothetical protein